MEPYSHHQYDMRSAPHQSLAPINSYAQSQPAHWSSAPAPHSYATGLYHGSAPAPAPSTSTITNILNDASGAPSHSSAAAPSHHHASVQYSDMSMGFAGRSSMSPSNFTEGYSSTQSPSSPSYTLTSPASPMGIAPNFGINSHRGSIAAPRQPSSARSFSHDSNMGYAAQHQHAQVAQAHAQAQAQVAAQHQSYNFDNQASFTPRTGYAPTTQPPPPMTYGMIDGAPSVVNPMGMMGAHEPQGLRQSSPGEPNHHDQLRQLMGSFSSKKRTGPQRKHQCRICQHAFTRPSSVDIHLRSHTGEKPFGCAVPGCERYFSVLSNARRHERTHQKKEAQKSASVRPQ